MQLILIMKMQKSYKTIVNYFCPSWFSQSMDKNKPAWKKIVISNKILIFNKIIEITIVILKNCTNPDKTLGSSPVDDEEDERAGQKTGSPRRLETRTIQDWMNKERLER